MDVNLSSSGTFKQEVVWTAGIKSGSNIKAETDYQDVDQIIIKQETLDNIQNEHPKTLTLIDEHVKQEDIKTTDIKNEVDPHEAKLCKLELEEIIIKDAIPEENIESDQEVEAEAEISPLTQKNFYKCDQCDYETVRKYNLNKHNKVHSEVKNFLCYLCDYSCRLKETLNKHILSHSANKTFKCNICSFNTHLKCGFKVHMRLHSGEKPYACDQCSLTYISSSSLLNHKKIHAKTLLVCETCDYNTYSKALLLRHIKTHSKNLGFTCGLCPNYVVKKRTLFEKHMKYAHAKRQKYSCDQCDYSNDNISLLIMHMKTH